MVGLNQGQPDVAGPSGEFGSSIVFTRPSSGSAPLELQVGPKRNILANIARVKVKNNLIKR
jgi:hypothetical protein